MNKQLECIDCNISFHLSFIALLIAYNLEFKPIVYMIATYTAICLLNLFFAEKAYRKEQKEKEKEKENTI